MTIRNYAALLLLIATAPASAGNWFWDKEVPPPPALEETKPFQLPTFDGRQGTTGEYIPPLRKAPGFNADALFNAAMNCYPGPSKWNIDVDLEAGYRTRGALGLDHTDIGGYYVGIVARMPLFSVTEMDRAREREAVRRQEMAKHIGELQQALAKRNAAHRELGLYTALESRSQVRVLNGITDASEQVNYLEKVLKAHEEVIIHSAILTEKRLAIIGLCRPEARPALDEYLRTVAELPPFQPLDREAQAAENRAAAAEVAASVKMKR